MKVGSCAFVTSSHPAPRDIPRPVSRLRPTVSALLSPQSTEAPKLPHLVNCLAPQP